MAELPEVSVVVNGVHVDGEGNESGEARRARRGSFIITIHNNDNNNDSVSRVALELLDLKRPFPPLKALDMEEVCQDVLHAIHAIKE